METYQEFEEYTHVIYLVYSDIEESEDPILSFESLTELIIYLNITDIRTMAYLGSMVDCDIFSYDENISVHKLVFDE